MKLLKQYFYNVFLTIDQSFNVIFLGGDPDLSISSHLSLAKTKKKKWFVDGAARFVDFLFHNPLYTIEENHVEKALEVDETNHKAIWKWYYES